MPKANPGTTSNWMRSIGLGSILLALTAAPLTAQALTKEQCDLNDDGVINVLDLFTVIGLLGTEAGVEEYRDGLDLVPDGNINLADYMALITSGCFGQTAETGPTTVRGLVTDGEGTPLPGVRVQVGENTVEGCSGPDGTYSLDILSGDVGDTKITFDGSGGSLCTPVDPTPGSLSGQYPTIPNKPIFVNGGTDNTFREMSLPERDLTGSVDLSEGGIATETPPGSGIWVLNQEIAYRNAGVDMMVPAGCSATFPEGEDPVLSITRVDPARLPVPMPPGLSSSIFVTYQPGGTVLTCPGGTPAFTSYDNSDGFRNGQGDLLDGPFLAGVVNGVFKPLVPCLVEGAVEDPPGSEIFTGGTVTCGPLPEEFEFAWYHTDFRPDPCPGTTVTGTVRDNDGPMTPVPGAIVSVPGVAPVTSAGDGTFSIPNVPAGPNGTSCMTNPFSIRASATNGSEFAASAFTPGVPGGTTDVGNIKFGLDGTVQGRGTKLSSINPFVVVPLPGVAVHPLEGGATVNLSPLPVPECCPPVGANGNFNIIDVSGGYDVEFTFEGQLPEPGGGIGQKFFSATQSGFIDFTGEIEVRDFRFTGTGAVKVTVVDEDGFSVPGAQIEVHASGGDLGGGYVAPPDWCFVFDFDGDGMEVCNGLPMGPCQISVIAGDFYGNGIDGSDAAVATPGELLVGGASCFINEHGELVDVTVEVAPPGDVERVTVSQAGWRQEPGGPTEDVVEIITDYSQPFLVDSFFDVFFVIELDVDPLAVPATGQESAISEIAPDATLLGVDITIVCAPFQEVECEVRDDIGNPLAIDAAFFEFQGSRVFLIVKDALKAAAEALRTGAGEGPYDMSVLSGVGVGGGLGGPGGPPGGPGGGLLILDVVPNGGSVQVDPDGFDQEFVDPLGDTFPFDPDEEATFTAFENPR